MNVLEPVERPRVTQDFWRGVFFASVALGVMTLTFIGVLTVIGWIA